MLIIIDSSWINGRIAGGCLHMGVHAVWEVDDDAPGLERMRLAGFAPGLVDTAELHAEDQDAAVVQLLREWHAAGKARERSGDVRVLNFTTTATRCLPGTKREEEDEDEDEDEEPRRKRPCPAVAPPGPREFLPGGE